MTDHLTRKRRQNQKIDLVTRMYAELDRPIFCSAEGIVLLLMIVPLASLLFWIWWTGR